MNCTYRLESFDPSTDSMCIEDPAIGIFETSIDLVSMKNVCLSDTRHLL